MNKKCFRVIFSKTLQRLVVVSELAKSEGKSTEQGDFGISALFAHLRPLTFSLYCALGFVAFSDAVLAETLIIQADKSAPKSQQPIVLQTANGLPQVNIRTPNAQGLSHNKYSKFDVDTQGAILNNSRTNVQTQQAGWVQGNPYLARGEARVILNEVNSNDPSVLKGYVEVAGKKADVIIANPSGIHCQGCGVINADRSTFTTGKPHIVQGNLDRFVVEKGKVKVEGKGLDNSRVDYTEILARETQLNGGVWSKKATTVVTGKNTLKRSDSAENVQIIHTRQPLADESTPQFAVDVGELGGMYAGKIHLIGTEHGVGVRNAGHIGASHNTLKIDSQGRLVNTGTLNANQAVDLTAAAGIENRGKIENRQGNIGLNTPKEIQQDGSIVARAGEIHKRASQGIRQQGETVAKGHIRYEAPSVTTGKTALIAAGVQVEARGKNETRTLDPQSAQGKQIEIRTTGKTTLQGKQIASGRLNIRAAEVNLDHSGNSAYDIEVQAKAGDIQVNDATLTAQDRLSLTTPKVLSTQSSQLTAKRIETTQSSLNAANAVWKQTGTGDFRLKGETVRTAGGTFSTEGHLFIDGKHLDNAGGVLSSGKSVTLNVLDSINSAKGQLVAFENLHLTTNTLNNDNGFIYAKQDIRLNSKTHLSNQQTKAENKGIVAGKHLSLNGKTLNNTQGKMAAQTLSLNAAELTNNDGLIYAADSLHLNTLKTHNHQGTLSSSKEAVLSFTQLEQEKGQIDAKNLQLNADTLISTNNSLIFAEQLKIETNGKLDNQDSRIVAKTDGRIVSGAPINNRRGIIGSQTGSLALNSDQQRLDNRQGKIVAAKMLALETGELDNDEGMISAADVSVDTHEQALSNRNTLTNVHNKGIMAQNTLQIKAGAVNNHQGYVQSQQDLQITSEEFNNQSGDILTLNKGRLDTAKLHNDGGKIRAEGQLDLNTHTLSQSGGLIKAGTLNMAASTINSTNQSEISAQSINLTADKINHHDSILVATQHIRVEAKDGLQNQRGTIASLQGNLTIDTAQSQLNNAEGTIAAQNAALTLQTGHIDNRQGRMRAKYATIDTRQHTLDNRNTLAEESQGIIVDDLTLNARTVNNQQGRITAKNNSEINIQTLDNQAGQLLTKQQGRLNAKQIDNTQGTIASTNGTLALSADSVLVNRQGNIGAFEQLALSTQGLVNQAGNIIASGRLILDTRQQTIDNQQGRIFALQTAQVDSGAIDNRQGLIRADNRLIINTHQNSLDNRLTQQQNQGIMGAGHIVLKAISELLNQKGTVYAQDALTANVQDRLSNNGGVVKSKGDLVLSAAVLDNQGGTIEAKTGTLTATQIDNRATSEKGSLILGIDLLQLNAHHIDNQGTKARSQLPTQGIQSKNIAIYTERLSNQKGGIYSSDSVNITANSRLDNQQGELLSTNAITVRDHGHLILNNQNGRIQGNNRIDLTAKRLESEGTIKTEGDLSVRLKDSFTLNRAFEVGNNLTFKTDGNFENNTALVVKNKASVAAHQIINNANGEISAAETRLQANSLTNRGVIDGNKTVIDSQEITNIGTGRIYGDHLAIQAQTLNNLAETVNGETHAGTIAARERLDLGIKTLTNRDHSLILSLGDLYIGGELDEHDNAIGRANFVDNGSATIDAMGNGNINSTRLLNHDLYTQTGIHTTKEKIAEHALGKEAQRYRDKRDGYYNVNNGSRNPNSYFQLTNGKRIEGFGWYSWFYTQTTHTTTLDHTDPAQISIGGSLKLDGDDLRNKYSKVLVGQQLWLGDTSFNENSQNTSLEGSKVKLINEDIIGEINKTNEGTYRIEYRVRKKKGRKGHYHYHHNNLKYGPDILPTEHFSFNQVLNTIGNPLTQSGASIEAKVSAKEIELEKVTITPTEQSNLQDMSTVMGDITDGKPVNISLTPFLTDNDKHQIVNSGQVIGKLDTTVNGLTQEKFDNLKLPVIKTHLTDIRLPQASLYTINPDSPKGYLVETDPKFTQRKQWLSSDYMFNALRYHHDNTHKRLGDGFYEQRLINEQIHQLTGRRYLHGFHNDIEQYKALMNSGVKYAQQFNLTVGIGLTAQQMSELTTDMVWLVNKEVTLAGGRKLTVLTPQVYLVARDSDINSRGAVISANEIIGSVGDVKNTGIIAGRDLTRIRSHNLTNQGAILGDTVDLSAKQTLINLGGKIEAVEALSLSAGKALEIGSTQSHSKSADGNFERTILDQIGSVKVTGQGGRLNLHSDGSMTIKAAAIESEGTVSAEAKSLSITTLNTRNKTHYNGDADNYYRLDQQGEVGSQIIGKQGITLISEDKMHIRQGRVSSEDGQVLIGSKTGDVTIEAGRASESLASGSKSTHRGLFSKTTTIERYQHKLSDAVGSEIDGKNVSIIAEQGNVTVRGSDVVAEKDLAISVQHNVSIVSDVNRRFREEERTTTKKGLMKGGSFGFMAGRKREQIEADNTEESAARSQVGALNGNVTISAGNHYQQTGSVVTSKTGDVDIYAKSGKVEAARSDYESNYKRTFEQKGVTVAVDSPVLQAAQAVGSTLNSVKQLGSSKNDRINALGAVNAGFEVLRTAEQVGKLAQNLAQNGAQAMSQGVTVSVTYGEQKSVETQHSEGNKVEKSQVNAGGKVNLQMSGGGKDSTLTIVGSDVSGQGGTRLKAEGKVDILAVDENHLERSRNKSQGFNAGLAVSYSGGSVAMGVTAGGNVARGYGNGESKAYVESQVGSLGSRTEIESGETLTVQGSQVLGKGVKVKADNLRIESLQDTMKYEGKQESASGQVTVGYGVSGSASYSKTKMKANSASVNKQAGIFAGDEGYDVDIAGHTELVGGLVTSTDKAEAEGQNRFATGTIASQDLENHADYKGSAVSASGSVAANFDTPFGEKGIAQSTKTKKDKAGNDVLTHGAESLQTGLVVGLGLDKDSQRSQTKSGINTANLVIRDEQAQLAKTGKTAEEAKAGLNTAITTDNAAAHSGKLENRFDKAKLQKELDYQVKATQEFQTITKPGIDGVMSQIAANKQAKAAALENTGDSQGAARLREEAKDWETGGKYRQATDALTNALGLALGGKPTAGVIAGAASPYINQKIKDITRDMPKLNIPAHMIWGAIEAELQGGKAASGAISAGVGEAGAAYLAKALYGTEKPENLTEEQKQHISTLSQFAAGVAGGLASAESAHSAVNNAAIGMGVAENAVEYNALSTNISQLKGLAKTEIEEHRKLSHLLEENGIENIDDYAREYSSCDNDKCRKSILSQLDKAFNQAYIKIDELAQSGELTVRDINSLDEYISRLKNAYDSKRFSEKDSSIIYTNGFLNVLGQNEDRLNQARLYALVSNLAAQGYTETQIEEKLKNENFAVSMSSSGISLGSYAERGGIGKKPVISNQQIKRVVSSVQAKVHVTLDDVFSRFKDKIKDQVTVYRVEGVPNQRLIINNSGDVFIIGNTTLYLNFGSKKRALEYLQQKVDKGLANAEIKSFIVPREYRNTLEKLAVSEKDIRTIDPNRQRPVIADPTKAKYQYGLRENQIQELKNKIISGSGKNGNE